MEAYLIVLVIVMAIVLLAANIYLLILYIHPDDKGWGSAIYCKILVVFGLMLCQAQALMIPLDVANQSAVIVNSMNMRDFWYFIYIIILIMITVLIPYAIFLYQTDEQDSLPRRLLVAFGYLFGTLVVSVLILFISWAFFKFVDLPYTQVVLDTDQIYLGNVQQPVYNKTTFQLQTSLAVYIAAIISFFGWFLVIIFGGIGLFSFPIDMINQFRHRPRPRRSKQMSKTKQKLATQISQLLSQGQKLRQQDQNTVSRNKQAGCFQKLKNNRKNNQKLNQFKAKYDFLSEQYRLFNLQLKYADTNPIIPFLKLLLGIIFFITSILWIIQIIFGNIAKTFNRPLIPFLNEFLIKLQNANAGFVATFVFAYICIYMTWCIQKGNLKFGIRIPFLCKFHPMKQNQTWMNSFLFNIILLLIGSVGVVQLCISSFPTYTRNSQIYMLFGVQIRYMRFFVGFYKNNVFQIAFIIWTFLALIYQIVTCNKKPKYLKDIDKIRSQQQQLQKLDNKSQN